MARIIYSGAVATIKGSIGGLTFHRNTSGNLIKMKPFNKNNSTKSYSEPKEIFQYLTDYWNGLSEDDKFSWTDELFGVTLTNRYGESKIRSGFNYFMSHNTGRLLLNLSLHNVPGSYLAAPNQGAFDFYLNDSQIMASFASVPVNANIYYFFYASPANRLSFSKQRTQFRLVLMHVCNGTRYFDLIPGWQEVFDMSWPPSTISNSFKITVAVCAFDIVHGTWSPFTFNTKDFIVSE
jgi:hypothetical protein